MDEGFEALSAVQHLILAHEGAGRVNEFDLTLNLSPSSAAVAGFVGELNEWGQVLTAKANREFSQKDYADYKITSDVLSRVTSWWLYSNQSLIQTIDSSADVGAATNAIKQATADLGATETSFKKGTAPLTDVSKILDGLFTLFKTATG